MKITERNIALRAVSLMIALLLIFGLAGCGKNAGSTLTLKLAAGSLKDIYPEKVRNELHVTDAATVEKQKPVVESGAVSLYLDRQTYSVAVKEILTDETVKWWYSLPAAEKDGNLKYDYSAAAVTLQVVSGSDTIYLNSQDNSVAFGKASYELVKNGVTVNYVMARDAAAANKTEFSKDDIAFSVSVSYTLEESGLNVTCSYKNLSNNGNAKVEYFGLLEFFGASYAAKAGDFMLVPDGCGALIYTGIAQKNFKPLEFEVYGSGAGSMDSSDKNILPAAVAAYGMKQGESGLAVIIQKGDAIAKITADLSSGKSGFNKVGAKFNTTSVFSQTKDGKINRIISNESFADSAEEEIKMCFRFIIGSGATYAGIASAVREQLIRDEVLSTKIVEDSEYLPFNLTVIGAAEKKMFRIGPLKSMQEFTTFEQAQDMLVRMKSKGINNINLRYKGALSGGLNQSDISEAGFMRSLGGKSGFKDLNDYIAAQKMSLYLDINLLSSREKTFVNESKTALAITGEKENYTTQNELYPFALNADFSKSLRRLSGLEDTVLKTLTNFRNSDFTGFCFNDAGHMLYSDYAGSYKNREVSKELIRDQVNSLSSGRKIMVDTGNFNAVKNADVIVSMPFETGVKESPAYQGVPFIPLIMHGIADYSGNPINEASNADLNGAAAEDFEEDKEIEDMMLKYIEFGACPSFEWCYSELEEGTDITDTFYYEDWLTAAVKYYMKANENLADLRDARMINHSKVAEGIFCTEYEGNSFIYINYTDKDFAVDKAGGFTVKAGDFIRIN